MFFWILVGLSVYWFLGAVAAFLAALGYGLLALLSCRRTPVVHNASLPPPPAP